MKLSLRPGGPRSLAAVIPSTACAATAPRLLPSAAAPFSTSASLREPPASDGSGNKGGQGANVTSTSALDYELSHRLRRLPPLPSLDPPQMDASEAVSNILYNTPPPSKEPFKRHILNTLVQNEPGVLSRVAGTLAARGFNIDSLVVCATEIKDLSRMSIVLRGQDGVVEQARRQLEDLVPVWAVLDYTQTKVIERELMLVKVSILGPEYFEESQVGGAAGGGRGGNESSYGEVGQHIPPELLAERESRSSNAPAGSSHHSTAHHHAPPQLTPTEALRVKSDITRAIMTLAEQFRGRVVDVSTASVIVEMSGKSSRCDAFLKLVRPYGILECARSGTMVLPRSPITSSWSGDSDAGAEAEGGEVDASLLPPG